MRSIPKLILVATFMVICAYAQSSVTLTKDIVMKGRLILSPKAVESSHTIIPMTSNPCCRDDTTCCEESAVSIKETGCESVLDLGVLVKIPKGSTTIVKGVELFLFSTHHELVFRTKTTSLNLMAKDNPSGNLLVMDRVAVSASQQHFVEGAKIAVNLTASGGKRTPASVYLVNVKKSQASKAKPSQKSGV